MYLRGLLYAQIPSQKNSWYLYHSQLNILLLYYVNYASFYTFNKNRI